MFEYIRKKLEKRRLKRTFQEYGYQLKTFTLPDEGDVQYAQWLHPFERTQKISQSQVNFYRRFIKAGDLAIDIGAHTGDTTVPMALAAGKEGLVLALEPNPYVFKILEENARLNTGKTNIRPLCFAATDTDGTFTFNYSDASFCNGGFLSNISRKRHGHNYTLGVEGKNLDGFLRLHYPSLLPRLSLIKVDAEGYDKEIVKTISHIIREYRPTLMLECYKRLNDEERHELYDVVARLGYSLYYLEGFLENSRRVNLEREDMNRWKHFEILALPV